MQRESWHLLQESPSVTATGRERRPWLPLQLKWKSLSHVRLLQPHGLYSPWNSLGQNIGLGSLSLLLGIFPTQGSNPGLPHYRWILYCLSHQVSPRILDWVVYPFSRGTSQPRNQTSTSPGNSRKTVNIYPCLRFKMHISILKAWRNYRVKKPVV